MNDGSFKALYKQKYCNGCSSRKLKLFNLNCTLVKIPGMIFFLTIKFRRGKFNRTEMGAISLASRIVPG